MKKVWFITGASKGLGLALAKKLIWNDYRVVATSRNISGLEKAIGETSDNFLPIEMCITDTADVSKAIQTAKEYFGQIDVVVNNAGYGVTGALEELTDEEVKENFNVNVFGAINVIRSVMPILRAQGTGHIFNIASVGGFYGNFPGWGVYCATKFAVHGFTESLAAEIKEFGLLATVVSPGYFRTAFLTSGSMTTPNNEMEVYTKVRASQKLHADQINNNQPGDPEKAADVLIKVAKMENPPLHLFLGEDAYQLVDTKIETLKKDLKLMKGSADATNFSLNLSKN
ncbi:short-chain dehydrogenase/reductase [Neptunitalea chrysea]|uniref:Short-chain dehydrogenase/reductase n=1 Tax=Neptunitalea chrysea TaxID=1647581 RepID=A0A9W6ETW7_9FLAO|nr:SDR family oxidoreductase [Neptunitalea chrysea]GLB51799.1 short-chain dehydrogenase/reductase [Neptunitalea chrysea]